MTLNRSLHTRHTNAPHHVMLAHGQRVARSHHHCPLPVLPRHCSGRRRRRRPLGHAVDLRVALRYQHGFELLGAHAAREAVAALVEAPHLRPPLYFRVRARLVEHHRRADELGNPLDDVPGRASGAGREERVSALLAAHRELQGPVDDGVARRLEGVLKVDPQPVADADGRRRPVLRRDLDDRVALFDLDHPLVAVE